MAEATYAPGRVIEARERLWRVDAQQGDVLTATPIDGSGAEQHRFYAPLENIQSGRLEWPSRTIVGTPQAQDLLQRAYRLSMLHGTAPLLSLQRSRVVPKDYQLVPVVMALEMQNRVRMLIADDVGLGKTIEAGLIITELMARQLASRVLVVVPAALREQWREALAYFFHIQARIISTRHRREMERELPAGASPWEQYPVLITSIDYAKQPRVKNQILEQSWDVALFDEAHLASKPHESGANQSATTARWELAQAIATSKRVRHLLLLTATPHNGYTDSFASLLDLLQVGLAGGPSHDPTIHRSDAQQYVCQRRREDVETWFEEDPEKSPFPDRDQDEVIIPPTSYEVKAIEAVEEYGQRVLESAKTGTAQSKTLANWTVLHLHKRALSSPEALRQSLKNRKQSLEQRLQKQLDAEAAISEDEARANVLDEDTGEHLDDEEAADRTERTVFGNPEAMQAELDELETAIKRANKVTPSRDNKLNKLRDVVLANRLRQDPKVIIFTRYVDTLTYLDEQVSGDKRYADTEVFTIQGSLNERQRREVFRAFDRSDKAVLIATDAISEGINLQHAASQVIHYELPWNPNRLEQRNGRVDRFGQRTPTVYIRTMVMDETLDASIMKVLVRKAAEIRRQYGFSPPYFGEETDILELLHDHDIAIGPKQLTLFDAPQEAPDEPGDDPFSTEKLDQIRDESFYGQTHISLPDIEERLEQTKRTIGSPEQVEQFVRSGLSRFGSRIEENDDGSYRMAVTHPSLQTASVEPVIERAAFDPEWGLDDPEVTVLDLGHPLVRRLVDVVKQNAFDPNTDHYGRTSYLVTPDTAEVVVVLQLLARYAVQPSGDGLTAILEEIVPVALPAYGGDPLPVDEAHRLGRATETPQTRTDEEVRETVEDFFDIHSDVEETLEAAVSERREALIEERRSMQQQLAERPGDQATQWIEGIDEIAPGSFDVLTVTVYYPA